MVFSMSALSWVFLIVGEAHFRIQGGPKPTLKSPGCTISGSMKHCTGVKTTPTVHNSSNWPGNRYRIVPIAHGMKSYGSKVVEKGVKKGGSRPVCLCVCLYVRSTRGLEGHFGFPFFALFPPFLFFHFPHTLVGPSSLLSLSLGSFCLSLSLS